MNLNPWMSVLEDPHLNIHKLLESFKIQFLIQTTLINLKDVLAKDLIKLIRNIIFFKILMKAIKVSNRQNQK